MLLEEMFLGLLMLPKSCLAAVLNTPSLRLGNLTAPISGSPWPDQFSVEHTPSSRLLTAQLLENSTMINGLEVMQYLSEQRFTAKFDFGSTSGSSRTFSASDFMDVFIRIEGRKAALENRFAIWGVLGLLQLVLERMDRDAKPPQAIDVDLYWTEGRVKRPLGRVYLGKSGLGRPTVENNTSDAIDVGDGPMTILPIAHDETATNTSANAVNLTSPGDTPFRTYIRSYGRRDMSVPQLVLPACALMITVASENQKDAQPGPLFFSYSPFMASSLTYTAATTSASLTHWSYRTAARGLVLMARHFVSTWPRKEVNIELATGRGILIATGSFLRRIPTPEQ